MPVTNEWLAGPSPTKRLDRELLEERILNLLSSQNMCVLTTSGADGPLATPVRYFHLDFALMFTAVPTSPKMRNVAADPGSRSVYSPRWWDRPAAEVSRSSDEPAFSGSMIRSSRTTGPRSGGSRIMWSVRARSTNRRPAR